MLAGSSAPPPTGTSVGDFPSRSHWWGGFAGRREHPALFALRLGQVGGLDRQLGGPAGDIGDAAHLRPRRARDAGRQREFRLRPDDEHSQRRHLRHLRPVRFLPLRPLPYRVQAAGLAERGIIGRGALLRPAAPRGAAGRTRRVARRVDPEETCGDCYHRDLATSWKFPAVRFALRRRQPGARALLCVDPLAGRAGLPVAVGLAANVDSGDAFLTAFTAARAARGLPAPLVTPRYQGEDPRFRRGSSVRQDLGGGRAPGDRKLGSRRLRAVGRQLGDRLWHRATAADPVGARRAACRGRLLRGGPLPPAFAVCRSVRGVGGGARGRRRGGQMTQPMRALSMAICRATARTALSSADTRTSPARRW